MRLYRILIRDIDTGQTLILPRVIGDIDLSDARSRFDVDTSPRDRPDRPERIRCVPRTRIDMRGEVVEVPSLRLP